jgi:hypothetical protein
VNRFIDELHVSMFLNVLNKNHFRSRNVWIVGYSPFFFMKHQPFWHNC